ncbi:MAG: ATP-binding protein, partial [Bacteroidota bacterium]
LVNTRLHLDDGTMYRLLVAGTEAVNNAIIHGNKSNPDKCVAMVVIWTADALTLRVKDSGTGFDPTTLPNPLADENLLKDSGRGIFLIRQMMDEVKFVPMKTGWMIEMKVNLKRLG